MDDEESLSTNGRSLIRKPNFFPQPKLRKLHGCQQVAAICYRVRNRGIEFLLIRTRGGRWTFPKGGIEPGLTHAQAAALEAFEEAGVHGRIEETSFTHYTRRKRNDMPRSARSAAKELQVNAHLCEVLRLGPPQESGRDPTWFSAQKAKRQLQQDRKPETGAELVRVVDLAVTRIQRFRNGHSKPPDGLQKDALQKVQFEAIERARSDGRLETASFVQYIRGQRGDKGASAAIKLAVNAYLGQCLRLGPAQESNQNPVGFSAGNAKQLLENRPPDCETEPAGVVDRAKSRMRQRAGTDMVAIPGRVQVIEIDNYPGGRRTRAKMRKKDASNKCLN